MDENLKYVGKNLPLHDAAAKATGAIRYTGDMKFPDMLHAKLLFSPVPHARIVHIDVSEALALQGVLGVYTHENTPESGYNSQVWYAGQQAVEILSTVRSTTQAKDQEIKDQTKRRLMTVLSMGTTTVEIKSGYGLTLSEELRALRLIKELEGEVPLDIVRTFMGAHAVPPGYNEDDFSELVIEEMLPRIASENAAEFCDVFCEPGVFSVINSEKILLKAKELGLKLKLHADELESAGGAECAARLGATSADHLLKISDQGTTDMAKEGVIAVLLPATSFNLAKNTYASGRKIIDSGVPVALSTDSNPGSSPTESMPFVMTLACLYLHFSPEEALTAATINAAHAVCRAQSVGSLEVGKKGDLVIFDAPNLNYIPYRFGYNPVQTVIKEGHLVVERKVFS